MWVASNPTSSLPSLCRDPLSRTFLFSQEGLRLPEGSTILLLRTLMTLACEPGILGAMSVGPSNIDPVFWVRGSPVGPCAYLYLGSSVANVSASLQQLLSV